MKRSLLTVISLLLIIGYGCENEKSNPTNTTPTTGVIQGKITDASSGSGISDVAVQTAPPTMTGNTNSIGEYSISDVPAGAYTVTASKTGYTGNSVSLSVTAGKTSTANIQLSGGSGQAPAAPLLASPSNGATGIGISPTLDWYASSGAASYRLQVATSSSFTNTVFNDSTLSGTSKQIVGLSNNTQYYWRMNAKNNYGTSSYSSVYSFTTAPVGSSGTPCPGIAKVSYAGKTYNTVQIGSQCWLKENLDVGTRINGNQNPSDNGTIEKYCYGDNDANCTTYGGLYQWNEAMQYVTTHGARGICPAGWHISTAAELYALSTIVDSNSNALKAQGHGTGSGAGTNTSGFSGLLAGYRYINGTFNSLSGNTSYWSSTLDGPGMIYCMYLVNDKSTLYLIFCTETFGISVRCVKD